MQHFETDQEAGEVVKDWLSRHLVPIVLGIGLGIAGLYGIEYYQDNKVKVLDNQSQLYSQLLKLSDSDNPENLKKAIEIPSQLEKSKEISAGYWELSQLQLANLELKNKQPQKAIEILDQLTKNSKQSSMKALAQYRKARIYFDTNQLDQALSTLNTLTDQGFQGLRKELEGDIYLIQGKKQEAINAFIAAKTAGGATDLLESKLQMLGIKQ